MIKISLKEIADAIEGDLVGSNNTVVNGVTIDSRAVQQGQCFFAIQGERFDGHDFIEQALRNGAACIVANKRKLDQSKKASESNFVFVEDTIEALGKLANHYRNKLNCKVISITGSVGKTTTREILHHVLKEKFKCHRAEKSFNNNIGLPLTILAAPEETEVLITELGANHPGEISYLSKIAQPDIAVITKIGLSHLEGFGNIEAIVHEKVSIIDGLKTGGKLIVNYNSPSLVDYLQDQSIDFISYGTDGSCGILAEKLNTNGLEGEIVINKEKISIPLPGVGNLENALAAFSVCSLLKISALDFKSAVRTFAPSDMRLEPMQFGSVRVICDCYNANPCSMVNALDCFATLIGSRRGVFICGTMGELGEDSEILHQQLGERIAKAGIHSLVCVGEHSKTIASTAAENSASIRTLCFSSTEQMCNNLDEIIQHDDIVLVKGSRSVQLEQAVEKIKDLFAY